MTDDSARQVERLRRERDALAAVLAEREAVLGRLTARLLDLERGQPGPGGAGAVHADGVEAGAAEELARLLATRTFRWTAPARAVWRRVRPVEAGVRRRLREVRVRP